MRPATPFEPSHLLFQFFNPTILGEDDDVLTGIRLAVWASGALAHDLLLLLVAQRSMRPRICSLAYRYCLVTPASLETVVKLMGVFARKSVVMAASTRWLVTSLRRWAWAARPPVLRSHPFMLMLVPPVVAAPGAAPIPQACTRGRTCCLWHRFALAQHGEGWADACL
jgi:hypothetical protein